MIWFIPSAILGVVATLIVRALARYFKILDAPDGDRKKHGRAVPLWGGLAIFGAFWLSMYYLLAYNPVSGLPLIQNRILVLFFGSLLLLLVGLADDIKPLPAWARLLFVIVAVGLVAVYLPLQQLTNPFGGVLTISTLIGTALVFGWLLISTMSIKLLDGVDGLAAGTVFLGALIIAAQTLSNKFYQPNVAIVALALAGAIFGFLLFNVPKASIFLGESGSLFIGFMIGGLSILAGSKMATALLVMAVPVLDLVRVVMVRLRRGQQPWNGDREHLHFVLLDRGLKQWHVLLLLLGCAGVFGAAGLFLQSYQKIIALLLAGVVFLLYVFKIKGTKRV
jgi:UDP-GlcNAc:undecaprenyl-phosphate GlcNAc-1-phosphate transferase